MRRAMLTAGAFAGGLMAVALSGQAAAAAADKAAVLTTYADIAEAGYADSLTTAKTLQQAVEALIAQPSEAAMKAARQAWIAARVPYMQTEVFRFGNTIVDDWEGKVNAWPLDEGLIDYVDTASYGTESDENPGYAADLIANPKLTIGGETIDATVITPALLQDKLQELAGIEANVATGYHAVEFLLWGQDLNGTGPGAGNRPWSDYATGAACSHGNCERRAAYLSTATRLLVDDLAWMAGQWSAGGAARAALLEGDPDAGVATILTGIGSLSYGELAGERMKLGLMLHDPEEEHDCFSDNTFNSHYYDIVGMLNVYSGTYRRVDGSTVSGPGVGDLVKATAPAVDQELAAKLQATLAAASAMKRRGETVEAYDQMIGPDNAEGNAVVQKVIDGLTVQTATLEKAVGALGLQPIAFEGSDSLDNPEAVFQ
ncbi:putative iron-regulated protein [Tistlia consotensis]|uniref:Putative iron-regulated protein n=1 Tax=Tistlia consotensis USBA 355 TaxID=560819 RepID=A0A1Y6CV30_9PROT|nr:imelysin family protein [Tistlia consotensis]SMF81367.1 putative iron-regulated protein [Tistlia consotensis USBA 355]SNS22720.1 putative iron-regulated protein [Tistlia consotensis]